MSSDFRSVREILRGGHVTRWHARPGVPAETVAHHHGQVAQLVIWITRGAASSELVRAALHHDAGELYAGDLPYPVKVALPKMTAAHEAYERKCRESIVAPWELSCAEHAILKLADRLAAYAHVAMTAPSVVGTAEWRHEADLLRQDSERLEVPHVGELVDALSEAPE